MLRSSDRPNFWPSWQYYHGLQSMTGVVLCVFIMFVTSVTYALMAFAMASALYFYIR